MRTLIFVSLLFFLCILPLSVVAQDTDSVKLQIEDIRYDEPTPIPHVEPSDSVLFTQDGQDYETKGYVIHTNLDSGLLLNLSKTRVSIDPQPMDTTNEEPVSLAIAADSEFSYQVLAVQQTPTSTSTGLKIDNTTCDIAFIPCTSSLGRKWISTGSYGFGYRMKGDDSGKDFHDSSVYRPFPLNSKKETPVVLMENNNTSGTRQNQLYLKTIFPPTYQEGTYVGDVSIIALPKM
jgi:hypothetical protein